MAIVVLSVGHTVLSINGQVADGRLLKNESGVRDILDVINDSENYPIAIKFGRAKLSSNEKIMLAGMFHSLVRCILLSYWCCVIVRHMSHRCLEECNIPSVR